MKIRNFLSVLYTTILLTMCIISGLSLSGCVESLEWSKDLRAIYLILSILALVVLLLSFKKYKDE